MKRKLHTLQSCCCWFALLISLEHALAVQGQEPAKPAPLLGEKVNLIGPSSNPYLSAQIPPGNIYHPFFDYSGAHSIFPAEIGLDYFGFRNDRNLYFEPVRDYRLIVLTSGSEGAGYSHKITIAEHMESMLNKKSKRPVRVLNLSMNSYCLSQEIAAYVHLAWHLKPEIVVSLTGWNDMTYGATVPAEFNQLGLHAPHFLENWSAAIHPTNPRRANSWAPRSGTDEMIVAGFLKNIAKYRALVTAGDATFVVALQGFDPQAGPVPEFYPPIYRRMEKLSHRVQTIPGFLDFTKNPALRHLDGVHSDDASSRLIAAGLVEKINPTDAP